MVLEIVSYIISIWFIDFICWSFLDWSPLHALRGWVTHRKALSPSERDRLLALEDAEADRMVARAEGKKSRPRRAKKSAG